MSGSRRRSRLPRPAVGDDALLPGDEWARTAGNDATALTRWKNTSSVRMGPARPGRRPGWQGRPRSVPNSMFFFFFSPRGTEAAPPPRPCKGRRVARASSHQVSAVVGRPVIKEAQSHARAKPTRAADELPVRRGRPQRSRERDCLVTKVMYRRTEQTPAASAAISWGRPHPGGRKFGQRRPAARECRSAVLDVDPASPAGGRAGPVPGRSPMTHGRQYRAGAVRPACRNLATPLPELSSPVKRLTASSSPGRPMARAPATALRWRPPTRALGRSATDVRASICVHRPV